MAYMSATGTGWQSCITDRHLLVLCTCMHVCLQRLIKLQGTKVFEQQAPKVTAAVVKAVRRALKQLPQDGFVQEQVSLASSCCSTSGLFSSDQWHGRVCLHENLLHGGIQPACRQDGSSLKPHAIASRACTKNPMYLRRCSLQPAPGTSRSGAVDWSNSPHRCRHAHQLCTAQFS